eukprot:SAG22_NODE_2191_length_2860_cov_22.131112_3_plen_78_part_00
MTGFRRASVATGGSSHVEGENAMGETGLNEGQGRVPGDCGADNRWDGKMVGRTGMRLHAKPIHVGKGSMSGGYEKRQ